MGANLRFFQRFSCVKMVTVLAPRNGCGINPKDNAIYCTTRDLGPEEQLVRIKCEFPPGWMLGDPPILGEVCYLGESTRSSDSDGTFFFPTLNGWCSGEVNRNSTHKYVIFHDFSYNHGISWGCLPYPKLSQELLQRPLILSPEITSWGEMASTHEAKFNASPTAPSAPSRDLPSPSPRNFPLTSCSPRARWKLKLLFQPTALILFQLGSCMFFKFQVSCVFRARFTCILFGSQECVSLSFFQLGSWNICFTQILSEKVRMAWETSTWPASTPARWPAPARASGWWDAMTTRPLGMAWSFFSTHFCWKKL